MVAMPAPALFDRLDELAPDFGGLFLEPHDDGYEAARRVHNGLVDKRPALIARCSGVADIMAAIELAHKLNLQIAVRGGGHNVAGRATLDGGLMIDLAMMKGVFVDPDTRTARAQGGVTWAGFNRETQVHGLATTGGVVSSTGVAGLTLGGGLGWLMSKYGMAVDNLYSAELITANGELLHANAEDNPDLFWALRGGGGNFGVVASLEFRLHPVGPVVTGGLIAYPFEKARDVLRHFRAVTSALPDELMMVSGLVHAPDGSGAKLAVIGLCHCGPLETAAAAVEPIKSLGSPVLDTVGPRSYCDLNTMLDAGFPKGALNYWKSSFLDRLDDQTIETMIDCFNRCPTPMGQLLLEHFHGAATRVPVNATAFPHRAAGYNAVIISQWNDRPITNRCIAWARDSYSALAPYTAAGRYVNYLGDDEAGDPVAAAYGPNHSRLRTIKAKYDPRNVFRMNQNILPASA
jgi:FAD/FMN-containing dehydrogenase